MNKKDNMNSPLRLLLIDDNPDDRALTLRELRREFEVQVQEILDAEGFASSLKKGDFDMATTDYQLKWSNGLEILRKIKARYPDCPVIMFTGTGNEEIAVEAMKHDLDDYVIKSSKHFKRLPAAVKATIKKAKERQVMRETQEALHESEERYRSLVESTEDSIYMVDRDCRYLFINKKHLSRFGLTLDEVIGRGYGEFHSQEETTEFSGKVKAVLETGESLSYEYGSERDGGYFIRTLSPVKGSDGTVTAVTVDSKDITERKQAEEELKHSQEQLRNLADHLQSVREDERTAIAREIHDELGQTLTGLNMDLSWMAKRIPEDQTELIDKLHSMSELTSTTIKTVQRISTELRPGLLDDLGAAAAIEWQTGEFQDRTGIKCSLTIDPEDITADDKRSTALFRILQETLTNVARHAQATSVQVNLREKGKHLELRVRDNGKGITKEQISNPLSLGIIGIKERVHSLGGEVDISGRPGKGTTVVVRMPVK